MTGRVISACELNATSRLLAALLVVGFVGGFIVFPILVGIGFIVAIGMTKVGSLIAAVSTLVIAILSAVLWVVLCRFVPRLLRLPDNVMLGEDGLIFSNRGVIHFRDIAAFSTDDVLKIRPRGGRTLLLVSSKPEYRPFCRAFVRQLKQWSANHPELESPVQTYFYGGLLARSIGWGVLGLIAVVLSMSLILGVGIGAAIAISVVSAPIPLKLAMGKRPVGGRVDEIVDPRNMV